jgi:hypothetical protein
MNSAVISAIVMPKAGQSFARCLLIQEEVIQRMVNSEQECIAMQPLAHQWILLNQWE